MSDKMSAVGDEEDDDTIVTETTPLMLLHNNALTHHHNNQAIGTCNDAASLTETKAGNLIVTSSTISNAIDDPATSYGASVLAENKVSVILELIGARQLPIFIHQSSIDQRLMETYCVVQYGTKIIHRTKLYMGPRISRKKRLVKRAARIGRVFGHRSKNPKDLTDDQRSIQTRMQNPIWTLQENSLCTFSISKADIDNNKLLKITVWARRQSHKKRKNGSDPGTPPTTPTSKLSKQPVLIGKVQVSVPRLLKEQCTEERIETQLVNDITGEPITKSGGGGSDDDSTATAGDNDEPSLLAYRCRVASNADLEFVRHWNQIYYVPPTPTPPASPGGSLRQQQQEKTTAPPPNTWQSWIKADIVCEPTKPRGILITEVPEYNVSNSTISTAVKGAVVRRASPVLRPSRKGKVRVKPYPDPMKQQQKLNSPVPLPPPSPRRQQLQQQPAQFLTPEMLEEQTNAPSRNWIQAGSKHTASLSDSNSSLPSESNLMGKLYLEILSAHNLPNVDIGSSVGNVTDAFVTALYGDAMVQTDVIDDELSPHWPCWSQRSFVFYMQHPSQMLYIGVFGFKRNPLNHVPIGRVEVNPINFQTNTIFNLTYELSSLSHVGAANNHKESSLSSVGSGHDNSARSSTVPTIRFRMRLEIPNERYKLLTTLLNPIPPPVYINVMKKKSLTVSRYTACGEYDDEQRFNLNVLQSYIDEILEGYIQRILYAIQDGTKSLVFWRGDDQFKIRFGCCGGGSKDEDSGFGFPIYSLMAFIFGMLLVEYPTQLFPSLLCFSCAMILLVQMQQRINSSSPWHRCFSFSHYLRILILGRSSYVKPSYRTIEEYEGYEGLQREEQTLFERIQHDKEFIEKKEAVEKEIEEIEKEKVQTKSESMIPVELLDVLGKVQSIVGDVCRLCRFLDAIITWEESDLSFWLTFGLLLAGLIFLFLPWAFLWRWTGRLLVVLFLGPQNMLIDLLWYQNVPTDEQQIYQLFARRMFEARQKQEDSGKLKAFRHALFGKYATWVPPLFWTPHQDFPLPQSTAYHESAVETKEQQELSKMKELFDVMDSDSSPLIAGQQLHGKMIPRPEEGWKRNSQESKMKLEAVKTTFFAEDSSDPSLQRHSSGSTLPSSSRRSRRSSVFEEGFEVTDMYDEEAGFVRDVLKKPREDSLNELGVEVLETGDPEDGDANTFFKTAWRSVHDFSEEEGDGPPTVNEYANALQPTPVAPVRMPKRDGNEQQSTIQLGLEVAEQIEGEKQFAEQSWRSGSARTLCPDLFHEKTEPSVGIYSLPSTQTPVTAPSIPTESMLESHALTRIPERERNDQQSTIELGLEVTENTDYISQPSRPSRISGIDEKKESHSTISDSYPESKVRSHEASRLTRHETWNDTSGSFSTATSAAAEPNIVVPSLPSSRGIPARIAERLENASANQADWITAREESGSSSSEDEHRATVVEGTKSSDGEDFGFEVIEP